MPFQIFQAGKQGMTSKKFDYQKSTGVNGKGLCYKQYLTEKK